MITYVQYVYCMTHFPSRSISWYESECHKKYILHFQSYLDAIFVCVFYSNKSNICFKYTSYRMLKSTKLCKNQDNCWNLVKVFFKKGRKDIFINYIHVNWLIYTWLKKPNIFPGRLANLVNKLVHSYLFVYLKCKCLWK